MGKRRVGSKRWRRSLFVLLAAVSGLGSWLLLKSLLPVGLPKDFPDAPEPQSLAPELGRLISNADAQAREHPASAEDVGRLGMVYHANQFYDRAVSAYRIASRVDPGDYRWFYYQALVDEENGLEKPQFALLQETVRLQPEFQPALVKLGDICFKQDNPEEAARYHDRAAKAAGGTPSPQAHFALARVAAKRQDWRKVVEHLAPAVREYPRFRPPRHLLADAYEALGQHERAADERWGLLRTDLIPIPPVKDPLAEALLPLCYSSTRLLKEAGLLNRFGNPDRALEVARRAIEVKPNDADARHFVSRVLLESRGGDPAAVDEALTQLDEGLRLRPDDLVPLYYAAAFLFKQKKTDAAVERLRGMLARNTGSAEAQYYLGLVADRQGREREAVAHYQDALRRDPGYAEPYHRIGLILASEGRLDQAIGYLRKAVSLKPMFIGARSHLGAALEYQGRVGEAMEQFREALRLKPNDTEPRLLLAGSLIRQGKLGEAAEHFRETTLITPGDAEAYYGLGCALAGQGKREEAVRQLQRALQLRPNYENVLRKLREIESRSR
jgi:tetratricopeptide (TPR) repeat protein